MTVLIANSAYANPGSSGAPREALYDPSSKSELWWGLGVGTLVGFGLGQGLQERWNRGWIFAVGDGTGLFLFLLGSLGTCGDSGVVPGSSECERLEKEYRTIRNIGLSIYGVSRVAEIVELLIYGAKEGAFSRQESSSGWKTVIFPAINGRGIQFAGSMQF